MTQEKKEISPISGTVISHYIRKTKILKTFLLGLVSWTIMFALLNLLISAMPTPAYSPLQTLLVSTPFFIVPLLLGIWKKYQALFALIPPTFLPLLFYLSNSHGSEWSLTATFLLTLIIASLISLSCMIGILINILAHLTKNQLNKN